VVDSRDPATTPKCWNLVPYSILFGNGSYPHPMVRYEEMGEKGIKGKLGRHMMRLIGESEIAYL